MSDSLSLPPSLVFPLGLFPQSLPVLLSASISSSTLAVAVAPILLFPLPVSPSLPLRLPYQPVCVCKDLLQYRAKPRPRIPNPRSLPANLAGGSALKTLAMDPEYGGISKGEAQGLLRGYMLQYTIM